MIETTPPDLPIARQCALLGLSRAGYYYVPRAEDAFHETLMRQMDAQYTRTPFYGVLRMTAWLRRHGYPVNPKRIRRLLRRMGITAVYPKPGLSQPLKGHPTYPYLLQGLGIDHPDHVWSADITYIRMAPGFLYLVAILDWHSRYVVSWEVSPTLEHEFCLSALDHALSVSQPEIFNTDQGSQFTSAEFTGRLEARGISISMDHRGRVFDNIFVERLWRTVKYEEVYLKSYETVREARGNLSRYFQFYNTERLHAALGYRTPSEVYFENGSTSTQVSMYLKPSCFLS